MKKYNAVQKANPTKPIKIFFTGHSLGAALANLATYDYWCNDWFKSQVIKESLVGTVTFGHAITFHGSKAIQHFQKIVPKERRMRINACAMAPSGILDGMFNKKCNVPTPPSKPIKSARCEAGGCRTKCDKNCDRNCDGRCNANCGHQCRQESWRTKGACVSKCAWTRGRCRAGCKTEEVKCGKEIGGCRTKCKADQVACKIEYGVKMTAYGIKYAAYGAAHSLYLACKKVMGIFSSGKKIATCDAVGFSVPSTGYIQTMDMDWQTAWVRNDDIDGLDAMKFKFGHCFGIPAGLHCHFLNRYMQGLRVHNRLNGGICSKISDPRNTLNLTPKPHGGGQEGFPTRVHLKNTCGASVRRGLVNFKTAASMSESDCRRIATEADAKAELKVEGEKSAVAKKVETAAKAELKVAGEKSAVATDMAADAQSNKDTADAKKAEINQGAAVRKVIKAKKVSQVAAKAALAAQNVATQADRLLLTALADHTAAVAGATAARLAAATAKEAATQAIDKLAEAATSTL